MTDWIQARIINYKRAAAQPLCSLHLIFQTGRHTFFFKKKRESSGTKTFWICYLGTGIIGAFLKKKKIPLTGTFQKQRQA